MAHNGNSNFAIWLMDIHGNKIELLVNEIGYFKGSKAVQIPYSGYYIMDVSADGYWATSFYGGKIEGQSYGDDTSNDNTEESKLDSSVKDDIEESKLDSSMVKGENVLEYCNNDENCVVEYAKINKKISFCRYLDSRKKRKSCEADVIDLIRLGFNS